MKAFSLFIDKKQKTFFFNIKNNCIKTGFSIKVTVSPSLQRLVQTIFTLQFFIIKFAAVSFQKGRKKFMKTQAEEAAIHIY